MNQGLARVHNVQTLGPSADTGPIMLEARYWPSWKFQVFGSGLITNGVLTLYGTLDPNTAGSMGIPGSAVNNRWFVLDAPADQAGAGNIANPLTVFDGTYSMSYAQPLIAVRYTTNAFTGGGAIIIDAIARA